MNSLLGGLGNSLFNSMRSSIPTTAAGAQTSPNILLQAVGAAIRGEDPHTFMQNLASQHPQLRQVDLSNLPAAAQQVCNQNGVDPNQVLSQLENQLNL